jgi:hypothetical protein
MGNYLHAPAALASGKETPVSIGLGGWVGPTAGLGAIEKRNFLVRVGNPNPVEACCNIHELST